MKKIHANCLFNALPPYFGGKRRLTPWIFGHLNQVIPQSQWPNHVFMDVFAGGCSVSLYAKAQGFKTVLSNDWADRTQIPFHALLLNQTQQLSKEDLLWLSQPLPVDAPAFTQNTLVPHVFSTRHAEALDRVWFWSHQFAGSQKRHLGLLLLWHLVHEYVCMPTSINSSNRPYAEALDGLRDWEAINPKRFVDGSMPRLLKPRWDGLERLRKRINGGVIGGSPVITHQQDACVFLQNTPADIVYLDPPYAASLGYESSHRVLDSVLKGQQIERSGAPSSFSQGVDALKPLLDSAQHIPVWILSYSNHVLTLPELQTLVQEIAPSRSVQGFERAYRHLGHVSKTQDRKELLIIATNREELT